MISLSCLILDGLTQLSDEPLSDSKIKISWYKDGQPINTANPIMSSRIRIFGQHSEQLKINSVRPEDVGLYQCFIRTDSSQEFQAASELRLGGKYVIQAFRYYILIVFYNLMPETN